MSKLILLVGPPGAGKSTLAKKYEAEGFVRVNRDDQGKQRHYDIFEEALKSGHNIVVDKMNFNKAQRATWLQQGVAKGYDTEIIVIHESQETCLDRMIQREGHPTIKDTETAEKVLHFFFSKYERPTLDEADMITFKYPKGPKRQIICIDLDGTMCNIDHRLHFMRGDKKDWNGFFSGIKDDIPNQWCLDLVNAMYFCGYKIVFASGRGKEYRAETVEWLRKYVSFDEWDLYMREKKDSRSDSIIKENILDFELLTKYRPVFFVDDRPSVCRTWRRRGYTVLQCNDIEF